MVMKRIAFVLLFFVSSCSWLSGDQRSVLDDSSCDLPCWNNIVAGQTSEQEVLQILSGLPVVDQESILVMDQPWNIFDNQIFFTLDLGNGFGQTEGSYSVVEITDERVSVLMLCGELNTTIGEIVEIIGDPEGLISDRDIAGGRYVILVNPGKGVYYWYSTAEVPRDMELTITPNIEVECLGLFDSAMYEEILDAGMLSMGHLNAEETLKMMYPWGGYGNLDEKYPLR